MRMRCRFAYAFVFFTVMCIASSAFAQVGVSQENKAAALNNQGLRLFASGQTDSAIMLYKEALAIDPNYREALSNLGLAFDKEGNEE